MCVRVFYFLSQISKYVLIRFLSNPLDHNRKNTAYTAALTLGCRADAVAPLDFWAHNLGTIIGNKLYSRVHGVHRPGFTGQFRVHGFSVRITVLRNVHDFSCNLPKYQMKTF